MSDQDIVGPPEPSFFQRAKSSLLSLFTLPPFDVDKVIATSATRRSAEFTKAAILSAPIKAVGAKASSAIKSGVVVIVIIATVALFLVLVTRNVADKVSR